MHPYLKKNEVTKFSVKWMGLDDKILSNIAQVLKEQTTQVLPHLWDLANYKCVCVCINKCACGNDVTCRKRTKKAKYWGMRKD